jgi:hypothetical protein
MSRFLPRIVNRLFGIKPFFMVFIKVGVRYGGCYDWWRGRGSIGKAPNMGMASLFKIFTKYQTLVPKPDE